MNLLGRGRKNTHASGAVDGQRVSGTLPVRVSKEVTLRFEMFPGKPYQTQNPKTNAHGGWQVVPSSAP